MLRTLMRPWVIAMAVIIVAATGAAHASTMSWAGQSWHVFKSTGALGQQWSPSMVSVSGSTLTERINGTKAGGVGSTTWHGYGTTSFDFRISKGGGKYVVLLSGKAGCPHDEWDLVEGSVGDSGRTRITTTRHWGAGRTNLIQYRATGDFSLWHHITATRSATRMTVALDGHVYANYSGAHVAQGPMHVAIQTAGTNVGGAGAPAQLQVKNLTIS